MKQLLRRRVALAFAVTVAALLVPQAASATTFTMRVEPNPNPLLADQFRFSPGYMTIYVGDTVHFEFAPGAIETVTQASSLGGCAAAASPLFNSNTTFDFTFTQAGVYPYFSSVGNHCSFEQMFGTITVLAMPSGGVPLPGTFANPAVTYPSFQSPLFVPPATYEEDGKGPSGAFDTGDIDGDGIADAVAARVDFTPSPGPTLIYTIFGRPHAAPRPPAAPWQTSLRPESLTLGDFNGDRRADLLVSEGGVVSYLEGGGDGTFGTPQAILSGVTHTIHQIATGDIDKDGYLDLLIPDTHRVVILYGKGDGTFRPAIELTPSGAQELADVAVADINGDGHPDVVVAESTESAAGRVYVYLQAASGGFTAAPQIVSNFEDSFVTDIATGDINGDGFDDVAASNAVGLISLFYGSANGLSVPLLIGYGDAGILGNFSLVVDDFDHDGRADVAVSTAPDGDYVSFFSGANPLGGRPYAAHTRFSSAGIRSADLNADGLPDLLAVSSVGGGLVVTLSGEADTTPPDVTVPSDFSAEAFSQVTFSATAHDAVFGDVPVSCTPSSPFIAAFGANEVTCTATDGADNAASATFTVTGLDTTAPAVMVPANFTANAGSAVAFTASAHDQVSGDLPVTCTKASGFIAAIGANAVTCSATDGSGNTGSASFTVTGLDVTPPVLSVPGTLTATATTPAGAVVNYSATATDNSGSATVSCTVASGSTFPIGSTPVSCTATDAAHNSSTGTFTVVISSPNLVTLVQQLKAQAAAAGMSQGDNNLDNVIRQLTNANGNTLNPACNNLNAFINKAGKLPQPAQSQLIGAAKNVGAFIGCR